MQTWIHYFPKSTRVLAKYPHGDFYSTKYIHMIVNLSQNCLFLNFFQPPKWLFGPPVYLLFQICFYLPVPKLTISIQTFQCLNVSY